MRAFLDKKFLLIIILITSCSQTADNSSNIIDNEEKIIEAVFETPIILEDEFKQENTLDDWSEFILLEYNILLLANSITGYLENDFNYLSETLNTLSNYSNNISNSEFQLYQERPEIKGRLKLLNIQIQKTNFNIKDWDKDKGLEELNKILKFYNYSINTIKSILNDDLESFKQGVPQPKLADEMFAAVRQGMGITDKEPEMAEGWFGFGEGDPIEAPEWLNDENKALWATTQPTDKDKRLVTQLEKLQRFIQAGLTDEANQVITKELKFLQR